MKIMNLNAWMMLACHRFRLSLQCWIEYKIFSRWKNESAVLTLVRWKFRNEKERNILTQVCFPFACAAGNSEYWAKVHVFFLLSNSRVSQSINRIFTFRFVRLWLALIFNVNMKPHVIYTRHTICGASWLTCAQCNRIPFACCTTHSVHI